MTNKIYEAMKKADALSKSRDDEFIDMMKKLNNGGKKHGKRPGILTKKERERINEGLDKKKKAQMDRIKEAYDKTYELVDETRKKNNV